MSSTNFPWSYSSKLGKKGTCPSCGRRGVFRYYYDNETHERLPETFGICDKDSCSYHERPTFKHPDMQEFLKSRKYNFNEFNEFNDTETPDNDKELIYLDKAELEGLTWYPLNDFIRFLLDLMSELEALKLCRMMNVKVLTNEDTLFIYEDLESRFTRGKIMKFGRNGHRLKDVNYSFDSAHNRLEVPDDLRPELHLYGLHLLNREENLNKSIAIVESEKSALLGNHFFPELVWMATSGLTNLNYKKLEPLKDREIILFPDRGFLEKWKKEVKDRDLNRFFNIKINDCFENKFYARGYDIADYIAFTYPRNDENIGFDKILLDDNNLKRISNLPDSIKEIKCTRNIERLNKVHKNYYSRFYYTLSGMKKEQRNKILIDNEPIVEIDAQALHPRILGKLFHDETGLDIPDFLIGDSHSKIKEILGLEDRGKAKRINLAYWNSEIINNKTVSSEENPGLFEKMDDFLKSNYPLLFQFLIDVKINQKPLDFDKPRHTNLSIMMFDREVRFMNELINTINEINCPCIYVCDAVYVKQSLSVTVREIFNEILNKHLGANNK